MIRTTIIKAFMNSWPMFVIVLVILISIRLTDCIINKKKIVLYKEFLALGFICYILCLFYVVTFSDVSWSGSNFNLFHEITRYHIGSRLFFKNVMSNMLMFIPYGLFVSYFLETKNIKPILILSFITSITIETTQLLIGRVFDVDDILLNIIGGICGYIIYKLLMIIKNLLPPFLKKDWFFNILAILLIGFMILYIMNAFNLGVWPW